MVGEKIVVGPECLILDKKTYPIAFGTMSSIQEYSDKVRSIEKEFQNEIRKAEARKTEALQEALTVLKGKLS